MHELSLAEEVAAIVSTHARGLAQVTSITLSIGELAGVELHALRFALASTLRGGKAEAAEILIETVPARARCPACGAEQPILARFEPCEACGAFGLHVLQGEGMQVRTIAGEVLPALR